MRYIFFPLVISGCLYRGVMSFVSVARSPVLQSNSHHNVFTRKFALNVGTTTSIVPDMMGSSMDYSYFAGKLIPVLSKLLITREDTNKIMMILRQDIDWREFMLLAGLGYGITPIMRVLYRMYIKKIFFWFAPDDFTSSKTYHVANHVAQGFKIACGVYSFDVLSHILVSMGVTLPWVTGLSKTLAAVAYTLWGLARFRGLKQLILLKVFKSKNVFEFYNRILNYLLYVITGIKIMDILMVSYGKAVSTMFAFGGVGTLVFSLASRELAVHFLSGVSLSLTEKFSPGDTIVCGDGTKGIVKSMGLFHTVLQGNDQVLVKIPNTLLDNQKVFNLSKGDTCQVTQKLCFFYKDIDKIPEIVKEIRAEIRASCPRLIGRPFRVHWSEFAETYLVVDVDARFNIKPVGDDYYDNKQEVLEAIARATKRCGVEFFTMTNNVLVMK